MVVGASGRADRRRHSWRIRLRCVDQQASRGARGSSMTPSTHDRPSATADRSLRTGPSSGKFVLALDQGTTSSRAIVFDRSGKAVASAQQEFPQIFPGPGHVEHDPEAIWSTQLQTAKDAIKTAGIAATDLAAIGVTNQRETTVLWEKATGKPIGNAIVWQSRVTAPICDRLKAARSEERRVGQE